MSDETTLLYLETDDEVTSVVRRVREARAERVVLVVPGRSRATSSVIVLRLLAKVGEEADRRVAVVGDALTRSLASEAGLDAYASVDDARQALPISVEAQGKGASIHVVRGEVSDETAPLAPAPRRLVMETETRPVVVPRPPRPLAAKRSTRRVGLPVALILAVLAALLIAAGVLGAVVLPAATVTIVPVSVPLGPVDYEIRVDDPERLTGSVEATATVVASGTYPIQAAATGSVLLFNWTFVPVEVTAGELVAAGDQAYATDAAIVVPPGDLTPDGRIQAGEGSVGVVAAAVGPAANVSASAIDTVLNESVAVRLRGFPSNPEPLVVNPGATAGGVDTTGPEITQADVDAAQLALLQDLDEAVADALEDSSEAIFADSAEQPEPLVEGLDGLVETRDEETAEISGTLAYDRLTGDRGEVMMAAEARLLDDATVLPQGHELLPDAMEAVIGEARREGDALVVRVSVTGASTPIIDRGEVIERVQGRSIDDAIAALAELGEPRIDLWPGWVASVPGLEWRIDVRVADGS